ncbi:MAG: thiol:disulfide interchange protein [Sulfurospirillum sp.]|nr:MAG: thiol:disulfide interchange protein [Sulfurospirillum sp.]
MKTIVVFLIIIFNGLLSANDFNSGVISANEAFKITAKTNKDSIGTNIKLSDGIYIYQDKVKYKIISPKKAVLNSTLNLPKPQKHDQYSVYMKELKVDIPFKVIDDIVGKQPFKLEVSCQGCSTKGLCYPPQSKTFSFDKNGKLIQNTEVKKEKNEVAVWGMDPKIQKRLENAKNKTQAHVVPNKSKNKSIEKKPIQNEQNRLLDMLKHSSFFVVLGLFFALGLGLAFTPCIFPMIPILSSIITLESKQSGNMSAKRGFFLSFVYIVSSALVYSIAGIFSAIFGANILSAMQNPWVIIVFALIFVALAFSMFGYYEIQLPKSLQNFANKKSEQSKGNGFFGVALMGALSALIVGPCVAPPLAAALIFIGQTGDILLGGLALFLLGLGMGAPLLLIGLGGGKFMPRPGGWMTKVSYVFGVIMLGIAISFLSRILPPQASMLLWSVLFIASGVYAGALEPFKEGANGAYKFIKVIAVILLAYGLILMFATFTGGKSPLDPLKNLQVNSKMQNLNSSNQAINFKIVQNKKDLAKEIATAKKPVFIDFSAKWCASCKELEDETFSDPRVQELMNRFKLIRIDVTKNSKTDLALQKTFGIVGPPAIVFYDLNKNELKDLQVVGFKDADKFIDILKKVLER